MGCGNEKSFSYCDSKYECENILRQYEEEVWKCFHKTFHSMIQKIASEKDVVSIRKVEDLFQTEYSPEMVAFIQAKIKEDKYRRNTHYFIKADYSFIEALDENHQGGERDIKEDNISPNIIIKEDRMDIDEEPVQEMVPKRNQPQRENVVKIPEKKDLRKEVKKKGNKEKNEEREKKINYLFKNVIPHMKYAVFLNDYINKDN